MYLLMQCIFCDEPLQYVHSEGRDMFSVYKCEDCNNQHHTLYRQLYNSPSYKKSPTEGVLADSIRIDEFYITRYYLPTSRGDRSNYSIIFREALGFLPDAPEPLSLNKPVCEIESIIELPWKDIALVKKKLDIWTTFS